MSFVVAAAYWCFEVHWGMSAECLALCDHCRATQHQVAQELQK